MKNKLLTEILTNGISETNRFFYRKKGNLIIRTSKADGSIKIVRVLQEG